MAQLNSWQKLTRILPGRPFGDGRDGSLTISSNTTQSTTTRSCSGSSGNATLSIASGAFSNGDVILIHQSRGTGVGQWEINQVLSGGGTTTLTLKYNKQYTYTDSGNSQAQVLKLPMYNNVTVNASQTWSAPKWNGDTGGILLFACSGTLTVNGSISATSRGYVGGQQHQGANGTGYDGEGTAGPAGNRNISNNGSGGGAGNGSGSKTPGAGGGHASAGQSFGSVQGGDACSSADLLNMAFGGAGGSGGTGADAFAIGCKGGDSGGIILAIAKIVNIVGSIVNRGQQGNTNVENNQGQQGGNGSGGATLIQCQNASLGSNIVATANNNSEGGDGSNGRTAVHYSGTISGSTSPSYNGNQDASLKEVLSAGLLLF